jgi:hypothetical protein
MAEPYNQNTAIGPGFADRARAKNEALNAFIDLQKRADDLANRLSCEDRALVFELSRELRARERRLSDIRFAANEL